MKLAFSIPIVNHSNNFHSSRPFEALNVRAEQNSSMLKKFFNSFTISDFTFSSLFSAMSPSKQYLEITSEEVEADDLMKRKAKEETQVESLTLKMVMNVHYLSQLWSKNVVDLNKL
jgi:hypothetical protein